MILVKRGVRLTETILAHELAHILQWRALGVFAFMFQYARHYLRYGYEAHPLEIAARLAEQDDYYLEWAREILRSGETPHRNTAPDNPERPGRRGGCQLVDPHESV